MLRNDNKLLVIVLSLLGFTFSVVFPDDSAPAQAISTPINQAVSSVADAVAAAQDNQASLRKSAFGTVDKMKSLVFSTSSAQKNAIRYGDVIALQHTASGRYLQINTSPYRHLSKKTEWKQVLCDDAAEKSSYGNLFIILSVSDDLFGRFVQSGDQVMLRHIRSDQLLTALASSDAPTQKKGLIAGTNDSKQSKATVLWELQAGVSKGMVYVGADVQLKNSAEKNQVVWLSSNSDNSFSFDERDTKKQAVIADNKSGGGASWSICYHFPLTDILLLESKNVVMTTYDDYGVPSYITRNKAQGDEDYHLQLGGTDYNNKDSWFQLGKKWRDGYLIGIHADVDGGVNLQGRPDSKKEGKRTYFKNEVLFDNNNFKSYEKWVVVPEAHGTVKLLSHASRGFLCAPIGSWANNNLWTTMQSRDDTAQPASIDNGLSMTFNQRANTSNMSIYYYGNLEEAKTNRLATGATVGNGSCSFSVVYNPWKQTVPLRPEWSCFSQDGFATGDFDLILDIKALKNAWIVFTSNPGLKENAYHLCLGVKNNQATVLRRSLNGEILHEEETKNILGGDKDTFWISVRKSQPAEKRTATISTRQGPKTSEWWVGKGPLTISIGRGDEIDKNLIFSYTDDKPVSTLLSCIGIGGLGAQVTANVLVRKVAPVKPEEHQDASQEENKEQEEDRKDREQEQGGAISFEDYDPKNPPQFTGYNRMQSQRDGIIVTYGTTFMIKDVDMRKVLYSSAQSYRHPGSSGQQMVTAQSYDRERHFENPDGISETWWQLLPADSTQRALGSVPLPGDKVRLLHLKTGQYLAIVPRANAPVSTDKSEICCLRAATDDQTLWNFDGAVVVFTTPATQADSLKKSVIYKTLGLSLQHVVSGNYLSVGQKIDDTNNEVCGDKRLLWYVIHIKVSGQKIAGQLPKIQVATIQSQTAQQSVSQASVIPPTASQQPVESKLPDAVAPSGFTLLDNGPFIAAAPAFYQQQDEVWAIGDKGAGLYLMRSGGLDQDFVKQSSVVDTAGTMATPEPLTAMTGLTISDAGTMYVINNGQAYVYDRAAAVWKEFDTGGMLIQSLSTRDDRAIWVVSADGTVYQKDENGWQARSEKGVANNVSIGSDGSVVAVNVQGQLFNYAEPNMWKEILSNGQSLAILQPANVHAGMLYSVTLPGRVAQYNDQKKTMFTLNHGTGMDGTTPSSGFKSIAANGYGTIVLIDTIGKVYRQIGHELLPSGQSSAPVQALIAAPAPLEAPAQPATPAPVEAADSPAPAASIAAPAPTSVVVPQRQVAPVRQRVIPQRTATRVPVSRASRATSVRG